MLSQHSSIKVYLLEIWSLHCWLVAFSYTVCCRVSNITKALISVNANPSQSNRCTFFSSPWTSLTTTIQCFGLPAVLGFWVSYVLVSSLTTPTSISTSTLMSPISTLTLSTLWWTPFAKVAISTLVLRNIISAPCAPLPCIYMYMSMAQRLAHISFSLRHHSKLTMADIWYSIQSSPLLGSLVATSFIASALAQLFQQPLMASPDHLIKMLSKWSSHAYQICIHTLISSIMGVASLLTWQVISCVSSSLSCYFCRVLQDFGSSGPGLAVGACSL